MFDFFFARKSLFIPCISPGWIGRSFPSWRWFPFFWRIFRWWQIWVALLFFRWSKREWRRSWLAPTVNPICWSAPVCHEDWECDCFELFSHFMGFRNTTNQQNRWIHNTINSVIRLSICDLSDMLSQKRTSNFHQEKWKRMVKCTGGVHIVI